MAIRSRPPGPDRHASLGVSSVRRLRMGCPPAGNYAVDFKLSPGRTAVCFEGAKTGSDPLQRGAIAAFAFFPQPQSLRRRLCAHRAPCRKKRSSITSRPGGSCRGGRIGGYVHHLDSDSAGRARISRGDGSRPGGGLALTAAALPIDTRIPVGDDAVADGRYSYPSHSALQQHLPLR